MLLREQTTHPDIAPFRKISPRLFGARLAGIFAVLGITALVIVSTSATAQATTNTLLVERAREYRDNPSAENKAQLERAQIEAKVIDYSMIGIPAIIVGCSVGYFLSRSHRFG